jgi:hypothetical protein
MCDDPRGVQVCEKQCKSCGKTKPMSDFYASSNSSDGAQRCCKKCDNARVRAYRGTAVGADRHIMYARERYRETAARCIKSAAEWVLNNPEKHKAQAAVHNAIRDGRVVRPSLCQECGKDCKPHAHHDDYSRRLDVRWLCASCHRSFHSALTSAVEEG